MLLHYLDFGVLPIEYEIHKRQLMFLHRILELEANDTSVSMFITFLSLTRKVKKIGGRMLRLLVKESVEKVAFSKLVLECTAKKKTADLGYDKLEIQEYFKTLFPNYAKIVSKCRSRT